MRVCVCEEGKRKGWGEERQRTRTCRVYKEALELLELKLLAVVYCVMWELDLRSSSLSE